MRFVFGISGISELFLFLGLCVRKFVIFVFVYDLKILANICTLAQFQNDLFVIELWWKLFDFHHKTLLMLHAILHQSTHNHNLHIHPEAVNVNVCVHMCVFRCICMCVFRILEKSIIPFQIQSTNVVAQIHGLFHEIQGEIYRWICVSNKCPFKREFLESVSKDC